MLHYILTLFRQTFKSSLENGLFPDDMNTIRVIPLFKSEDANFFSNYRQTSFTSVLPRLNAKQLLYLREYDFRNNMSTSIAILEIVE